MKKVLILNVLELHFSLQLKYVYLCKNEFLIVIAVLYLLLKLVKMITATGENTLDSLLSVPPVSCISRCKLLIVWTLTHSQVNCYRQPPV